MKVLNFLWPQAAGHKLHAVSWRLTAYSLLFFISSQTHAQSILKGEYFFDTDPGVGNGAALTFAPGSTVNFTSSISTASLSSGFHQLAIRVKETGGVWSAFEGRGFYISTTTADSPNIVGAEYFFDADPGNGNGIPIAVTAGASVTFTVSLPTSLSAGFHFLAIRTKGANGKWGVFEARGFYVTGSTSDSPNITAAEYFFDADPGNGNGINIPVTAGAIVNFTVSLPTSLASGFHFLAIRTKGANGRWGVFEARGFYVTGSTSDVPDITKAEYFFDTDPGVGNGINIPITAGASPNFTVSLPTTGLTTGFHFLAIRTKRADGKWGVFESRGFYVSPIAANAADIVAAEYFIDGVDPGEGNGLPLTVTTPGPTVNQSFVIVLSGVPSGARKLNLRVKDANGIWSAIETAGFSVLVCTPPPAPAAAGASRCNNGTVILNATAGAAGTQVYRWYADATSTTILFTGAAFTTPSINTTTNFFVSVFDPATLCESNRTAVIAAVISTSPPQLNITSATICAGNSIKVSAPTGFTTYLWSNGETTREIAVIASGNYSVIVGNGTCESQPSVPASIIVSPKPTKPVITTSGSASLCDGATVTLSAPAGFSYLWSDGKNTQDNIVSIGGTYSVVVSDGSNCSSDPSVSVVVSTFTTPAKPIINVFGSTALCGTNTVGVLAPSGFSIYQWSGGQTTQGLTVSTAGTFSVIAGNAANCLSIASDLVTVTSTGQPCTTTGGTNSPPVIAEQTLSVQIEGRLEKDLIPFLSDPDNNLDFTSLRVINNETSKGIPASIDAAYNLVVNYTGNPFTGSDRVTIEVCDLAGVCAQQVININVVGDVLVFNGMTPDGDGFNDFLLLKYVDVVEGASKNKVTIYNRWGDVVFDVDDYDNLSRVFAGQTNGGKDLPSGTYFYKIDFANNSKTGFITLKR